MDIIEHYKWVDPEGMVDTNAFVWGRLQHMMNFNNEIQFYFLF